MIVAHNSLQTDHIFNEAFKIHKDASAFKLGAIVSQEGKPINYTLDI